MFNIQLFIVTINIHGGFSTKRKIKSLLLSHLERIKRPTFFFVVWNIHGSKERLYVSMIIIEMCILLLVSNYWNIVISCYWLMLSIGVWSMYEAIVWCHLNCKLNYVTIIKAISIRRYVISIGKSIFVAADWNSLVLTRNQSAAVRQSVQKMSISTWILSPNKSYVLSIKCWWTIQ